MGGISGCASESLLQFPAPYQWARLGNPALRAFGLCAALSDGFSLLRVPLIETHIVQSDGEMKAGQAPTGLAAGALAALAREELGGWFEVMGLEILSASAREVIAEWTVAPRHLQPQGIVHGGVYASVVETCCSVGAALAAPAGKQVVGVENHTSFLRPVSEGRLRALARPLHAGRQAQLWECSITDPAQRLVATGRLRVFCIEAPVPGSTRPT